jgi:hypothetical protein
LPFHSITLSARAQRRRNGEELGGPEGGHGCPGTEIKVQ